MPARFIVGMPRAGTSWLCQSLNQHADLAGFGETMFWGKAFVPPNEKGTYGRTEQAQARARLLAKPFETTFAIDGPGMTRLARAELTRVVQAAFDQLPAEVTPGELFVLLCGCIARAEGKRQWIEKTPHHLLYAERILQHLPTAKFVVLVREPYAFMRSYKHQKGYQRTKESRRRFERRYHPIACALVWRNSWRAAARLVQAHPNQALLVRLEEIETEPQEVMQRVASVLGLSEDPSCQGITIKINSSFDSEALPEVTDADVGWLNLLAGREVRAAGYPLRSWSALSIDFCRSVVDLPGWALRMAEDLRQTTGGSVFGHLHRWVRRNA